jgi:hypothetical protein
MQAIGFRLLVALVTFTIGLACVRLTQLYSTPADKPIKTVFIPAGSSVNTPRFRFVERSCESGCIEIYETSGGKQISSVLACFTGSAPDARRAMEDFIKEGTVVERRWQTERQGTVERMVERTVVLYPKDEIGDSPAKIFTYRRGDICFEYIEAGSLELALEFEQSGIKFRDDVLMEESSDQFP